MVTDCPNYGKPARKNSKKYAAVMSEINHTYYPFFEKLSPIFDYSTSLPLFNTMLRIWDVINVDNYLGRPLPPKFEVQD